MNRVKLRDVASVIMGQAPPSKSYNKEGRGVPFVKVANFSTDYPEIIEWTDEPKKMAQEGDILICVVGKVGVTNLGIDAAIGRSVAAIRPDNGKIDQSFLRHFLKSKILQFTHQGQGAIQKVLTSKMLSEINIPKIPIAEQKRIATILDKAKDLKKHVTKNQYIRGKLLTSIFLEMFGDPAINVACWPMMSLDEAFCEIRNGLSIKQTSNSGGLPISRIETISDRTINYSKVGYAGIMKGDKDEWLLRSGDILFSHINSVPHLGKCAIFSENDGIMLHGMNLLRFRTNDEIINPVYSYYFLNTDYFRQNMMRFVNKSVNQASISTTNLKKLTILIPPMELQLQFEQLYIEFHSINSHDGKFEDIYDSIAQEMLT